MSSSAVIEALQEEYKDGSGTIAYFYIEFGDLPTRHIRNLLSSLLIQLAAHSDTRCKVLHDLYSKHDNGAKEPTEEALLESLKEMLKITTQGLTFIIIDGLNEALPSASQYDPTKIVEELVGLGLQDLRIFATCLAVLDPEEEPPLHLESVATHPVCLHQTKGHLDDIVFYIDWRIKENKRMKRWRHEDKVDTVETLSKKGGGS